MVETYTIRPFFENDWEDLKRLRLEALRKHPSFFSPSRDETKFTESEWKQRITNPKNCIFALLFENKIIGITGIVTDKDDDTKAHLVMSFIQEEFRRKNLSKLLYQSRLDWAKARPNLKTLVLDVNEDNVPSRNACQNNGFKLISSYVENGKKLLTFQLDLFS